MHAYLSHLHLLSLSLSLSLSWSLPVECGGIMNALGVLCLVSCFQGCAQEHERRADILCDCTARL